MKQRPMKGHGSAGNPYLRLAAMAVLSFVAMFTLMYAMVDRFANVFLHLNQVYMAGLITAPMVVIEILVMWSMYPNRKVNVGVLAASAALLGASWVSIRAQAGITDRQFLRSMIPHHGGQFSCASRRASTIRPSKAYARASFRHSSGRSIS